LWVIACDKCPECPAFLPDVNGPAGKRDKRTHTRSRDTLSIDHAYHVARGSCGEAKLNLHNHLSDYARPDLRASSGAQIARGENLSAASRLLFAIAADLNEDSLLLYREGE